MTALRVRRVFLTSWIAVAGLIVTACGKGGLAGTYHDPSGAITMEFKAGKATITMMGESRELTYKVEGNKITVHDSADAQGADLILTRNGDGSLSSPLGTLTRK